MNPYFDQTNFTADQAMVGGDIDDLHPKVQWIWRHTGTHNGAASDLFWGTSDSFTIGVAPWGGNYQVLATSGLGGLQETGIHLWNDVAFWQNGNLVVNGIYAYRQDAGVYPFIAFGNDYSQGAAGLGTDGNDMVWIYSQGKGDDEQPYPINSVMTAKYTPDATQIQPRRLTNYPTTAPVIAPTIVGCGYAARWTYDAILVVRIADGYHWLFQSPGADAAHGWGFADVYAITCDEIFLNGGSVNNIARVRIDALGDPSPPD